MSKPTLLIAGNLKATKYSPPQDELDKIIPIDYIMDWFDQRIPQDIYGNPKIIAKNSLDRVMILQSSTGSGKSTLIPPYFYQLFFKKTKKNSAVTQPRILTAIEISKNTIPPFNTREELAKSHPTWEPIQFGVNIGVQTSIFQKRPVKGIIYMTSGVLTQQLFAMDTESFIKKYNLIVIDEAHERSIELDLLLYMLKKFIKQNYQNKECPFILIMSATINTKKFADYFLDDIPTAERYKSIIKVAGFSYPIEEIYLTYDTQDIYSSIIDRVKQIHIENQQDFLPVKELIKLFGSKPEYNFKLDEDFKNTDIIKNQRYRDILVFIKGPSEIRSLKKMINKLNTKDNFFNKYPLLPLGLTSELVENQSVEYRSAVERDIEDLHVEIKEYQGKQTKIIIKKPVRRVIFASNVAETGLTVTSLKYIIDPGYYYSNEFNPCFSASCLISKPVTQSMHKQRKGRVGRKHIGFCYSMFTEEVFNQMQGDQYPDIIKREITLELLGILVRESDLEHKLNSNSLKKLLIDSETFYEDICKSNINILKLDLLDLPSADSLKYSIEKLYILGAINSNSIPTKLGFVINKFRFLPIESIKMILSGYAWNAPIQDLITIITFLKYSDDLFIRDEESKLIDAEITGKFNLFSEFNNKINYYSIIKTDLMMADEFIKYILFFHELQNKISNINIENMKLENFVESKDNITGGSKYQFNHKKNIIDILNNWGDLYGINIKTVLEILELRDTIINVMAVLGLNPYHNYQKSYNNIYKQATDHELMLYICNIKQCIYEGYKLNLAVWNPIDKLYYTKKTHLPMNIKSSCILTKFDIMKYGDSNPKYLIFDEVKYIMKRESEIYESEVRNISVMDGFITIDPNFEIF